MLTGKDDERIKQFGHDKLSVFGIGTELDHKQWRTVFRQLISRNLLSVDVEGHGSLQLTERCRAVLRGEQVLQLRKESKRATSSRKGRKSFTSDSTSDNALWDALRECRKKLAEEHGVPPYVIFHDATLMQMLEQQPQNDQQFLNLNGVGESKRDKYADAFLQVIMQHNNNERRSNADTINESLALFRGGQDIESIASKRGLKASTIYSHLASCIEQGELRLEEVIDIDSDELSIIHETLLSIDDGSRKLKPLYDALDGMYDYNTLRCVQAAVLPA